MDVFSATLWALDFALFVFCKGKDDFERLLAIFAVKLIAGHDDLRRTSREDGVSNQPCTPGERPCQAKVGLRTGQELHKPGQQKDSARSKPLWERCSNVSCRSAKMHELRPAAWCFATRRQQWRPDCRRQGRLADATNNVGNTFLRSGEPNPERLARFVDLLGVRSEGQYTPTATPGRPRQPCA